MDDVISDVISDVIGDVIAERDHAHAEMVIADGDLAHADMGAAFRRLLRSIERLEEPRWREDGARDAAHWVSMYYGVSEWKARRWLGAAHALGSLPEIERALITGRLGIDKALELCRFATPRSEVDLLGWARAVSPTAVRRRADAAVERTREELLEVQRSRFLHTWYVDDGRRMGLEAELPAAEGAIVEAAIERVMREVAVMPGEGEELSAEARRADALVAIAAARIADDPDPDRATVVIHAPLEAVSDGTAGAEVEDGPPVPADTLRRLLCTGRFQTIVEDGAGDVVALGEMSRLAPAWMLRQVRYRDRGCRFPGCGARRFTEAHHIAFFRHGGRTRLDNLVLICSFHHRLVHEHGWRIERSSGGALRWRRPDGAEHPGVEHPRAEHPGAEHPGAGPPARAPTDLVSA